MGHGAWMKITWDQNIAPKTLHASMEICFENSNHLGIEISAKIAHKYSTCFDG
jgi:hypothetical protein